MGSGYIYIYMLFTHAQSKNSPTQTAREQFMVSLISDIHIRMCHSLQAFQIFTVTLYKHNAETEQSWFGIASCKKMGKAWHAFWGNFPIQPSRSRVVLSTTPSIKSSWRNSTAIHGADEKCQVIQVNSFIHLKHAVQRFKHELDPNLLRQDEMKTVKHAEAESSWPYSYNLWQRPLGN